MKKGYAQALTLVIGLMVSVVVMLCAWLFESFFGPVVAVVIGLVGVILAILSFEFSLNRWKELEKLAAWMRNFSKSIKTPSAEGKLIEKVGKPSENRSAAAIRGSSAVHKGNGKLPPEKHP